MYLNSTYPHGRERVTALDVQGGSNMTGTNCDLFTHNQSLSYLNHLVCFLPRIVIYHQIQNQQNYHVSCISLHEPTCFGPIRPSSVCLLLQNTLVSKCAGPIYKSNKNTNKMHTFCVFFLHLHVSAHLGHLQGASVTEYLSLKMSYIQTFIGMEWYCVYVEKC
jgi:hypothetical protein